MNVKINPFCASGQIMIPPSKSHVHRLLICSALSKGKTVVKNVGSSDDVLRTIDCLKSLGANIVLDGSDAEVFGIEQINKTAILNCGESGSTLRFIMPISSALGVDATFIGKGKLLSRPNDNLFEVLSAHGIKIDGFNLKGKLSGGEFNIDASISSQYVTGLLFASVITGVDCVINLIGTAVSKSYINITLGVMKEFGIKFEVEENRIFIPGNQCFISPTEICAEGDWSSSAFPLVLGALSGSVTVSGLNLDSLQGDKVIIKVLENSGCKIDKQKNSVTVYKSNLSPIDFDIEDCPDTAPIVSVLASKINGVSVLRNVERLKVKESNRLEAIIENLKKAGVKTWLEQNDLYIEGGNPKPSEFDGYSDHRIVMAFTVLGAVVEGESIVSDREAVKKSYPEFFDQLTLIGGKDYVAF